MNATGPASARETGTSAAKPKLRVLLVEDDAADRELILRELGKGEFEISATWSRPPRSSGSG